MNQTSLKRTVVTKVLLALLVLGAITVAEVIGVVAVLLLDISDESLMASIIPEAAGCAAAVGGFILLGGKDWSSTSKDDIVYTFRFGWFCMAISLVLMVMELYDYATGGTPLASDAALRFIEVAIMCLLIGLFEEAMFRGVIFQALLAIFGGSHRGVVIAVMLTSFFFGCAHVDFSSDFAEPLMAVQGVCKIVQTGMYSILLCIILLRTHKLGGVSLFHAVDDFVLIFPSVALFSEELDTEYVTSGDDAIGSIVFYLIIIALYLPFTVKALLELHRGQDVYRGVFMDKTMAQLQQEAMAQGYVGAPAVGAAPVASGPVMPSIQMAYPGAQSSYGAASNPGYGAQGPAGYERTMLVETPQLRGTAMRVAPAQAQWAAQTGQAAGASGAQQWQTPAPQGQAQRPGMGYGAQQWQAPAATGAQRWQAPAATGAQQWQAPAATGAQQWQAPAAQAYQTPQQSWAPAQQAQPPMPPAYQAPSQPVQQWQAPATQTGQQAYQAPYPSQAQQPAMGQYRQPAAQQWQASATQTGQQAYQAPYPSQAQQPTMGQYRQPAAQQYQAPAAQPYQRPQGYVQPQQQVRAQAPYQGQQWQAAQPQQQYQQPAVQPQQYQQPYGQQRGVAQMPPQYQRPEETPRDGQAGESQDAPGTQPPAQ